MADISSGLRYAGCRVDRIKLCIKIEKDALIRKRLHGGNAV